MVTRKPSIPAPNSLPPPPPPNFAPSQPNHDIDSGDLPPVPSTRNRPEDDSPYADMGNPWVEATSVTTHSDRNHPAILRPGFAQAPSSAVVQEEQDVMKPGWSGQNTPRSSLDSDRSRDFWESSDDEDKGEDKIDKNKGKEKGKEKPQMQASARIPARSESTEDLVIPSPLQIRRKPVATSPLQESQPTFTLTEPAPDLASNNPFRQGPPSKQQPHIDLLPSWGSGIKHNSKGPEPSSFNHSANLSLRNDSDAGFSSHQPIQPLSTSTSSLQQPHRPPPQPQSPPPPIPVPHVSSPFSEQPPLIPVSPRGDDVINPWTLPQGISGNPSPIPFAPSQKQDTHSTDNLLDRGSKADGRISLGDELKALPNAAKTSTSQTSLLDDENPLSQPFRPLQPHVDEEYFPPPGPPPSHTSRHQQPTSPAPPTKPPRPAIVVQPLSDAEIARLREQRNETYQIKHFNWFDHRTGKMRTSSMLTQNKNGPCPLLALVNALILGIGDESQASLDDALKSREQVTLGLIIETLMDELISSGVHLDGELPDVDDLNKFLVKLRTGMNMNPRFVQPRASPPNLMDARNSILDMPTSQSRDQPGNFELTEDIKLYSAFGIRTVHGWLPDPQSEVVTAFARSAQNYEDAQAVQFGEEELEYKLSNGGLTPREQQLWQDIISIKDFLRSFPTQLTPFGLNCIKQSMQSGSFAILFRNDHFSTIYKHPRDGNLYTLITDAGYADRDEIIWESLVDITGQYSEFFSGDFQSVSHHASESRRRSSHLSTGSAVIEPLSPQQQQEQHDADFAMALQLQEEEEQRMRQERGNRAASGSGPAGRDHGPAGRGNGSAGRGSGTPRRGQGIPIPLRSTDSRENRPTIPPRNQRSNIPAVNRPSDTLDADAPPTYEEAARGKPYNPPLGSPLHPESSASAEPSPYNSTSHVNLPEAATGSNDMPPALRRPERRQSAYNENFDRVGHTSPRTSSGRFEFGMNPASNDRNPRMPGAYVPTSQGGFGQGMNNAGGISGRRRGQDGDCSVM